MITEDTRKKKRDLMRFETTTFAEEVSIVSRIVPREYVFLFP